MPDYTLAVGTHDPQGFSASSDDDAIRRAIGLVESKYAGELVRQPHDVVTLLGAGGLLTRPSERLDEFVRRLPGPHPEIDTDTLQPGDTNTPDCNGD